MIKLEGRMREVVASIHSTNFERYKIGLKGLEERVGEVGSSTLPLTKILTTNNYQLKKKKIGTTVAIGY